MNKYFLIFFGAISFASGIAVSNSVLDRTVPVATADAVPVAVVTEPAVEVAPLIEPTEREMKLARLEEMEIDCSDFYNPDNLAVADTNGNGALDMADEIDICVVPAE